MIRFSVFVLREKNSSNVITYKGLIRTMPISDKRVFVVVGVSNSKNRYRLNYL